MSKSEPFRRGIKGIPPCVAALLAVLALAPPSNAAVQWPDDPPKDADHAKRIVEFMETHKFRLRDPPWVEKELIPFCRRLGDDLRTQTGITHIEPVARAKYYSDPIFQPFRDRCPGLELNGVLWPADWYDPDYAHAWKRMTEAQRDSKARASWLKLFGTRHFKMYHLDLDGDPSNGKEYVFLAERFYILRDKVGDNFRYHMLPRSVDWNDLMPPESVEGPGLYGDGKFMVLDLDQCKRGDTTHVTDPYRTHGIKTLKNFGGIFRYQGRHYVFSFYVLSSSVVYEDGYGISIESYGENAALDPRKYHSGTTGFSTICVFEEIGDADEPKDRTR